MSSRDDTSKKSADNNVGKSGTLELDLSECGRAAAVRPRQNSTTSPGRRRFAMLSPRNIFRRRRNSKTSASLDEDALRALRDALPDTAANADVSRTPSSPSLKPMSLDASELAEMYAKSNSRYGKDSPTSTSRRRVLSFDGSAQCFFIDQDEAPVCRSPNSEKSTVPLVDKVQLDPIVVQGQLIVNGRPKYVVIRGKYFIHTPPEAMNGAKVVKQVVVGASSSANKTRSAQGSIFLPQVKCVTDSGDLITTVSAESSGVFLLTPKNARVQKLWRCETVPEGGVESQTWLTHIIKLTGANSEAHATTGDVDDDGDVESSAPDASASPRRLREQILSPAQLSKMSEKEIEHEAEKVSMRDGRYQNDDDGDTFSDFDTDISPRLSLIAGHRSPRSGPSSPREEPKKISTLSPRITPRSSRVQWIPAHPTPLAVSSSTSQSSVPEPTAGPSDVCERCSQSKARAIVKFEGGSSRRLCRACVVELGGELPPAAEPKAHGDHEQLLELDHNPQQNILSSALARTESAQAKSSEIEKSFEQYFNDL